MQHFAAQRSTPETQALPESWSVIMGLSRDSAMRLLLAASFVFAVTAWGNRASTPRRVVAPPFKVGESFTAVFPPGRTVQAVLLFIDKDCDACSASEAFYRTLAASPPPATNITVIASEDEAVVKQKLAAWRLRATRVMKVPRSELPARIPTLVLLDKTGRVIFVSQEALLPEEYQHIIGRLVLGPAPKGG